MNTPQNMVFFIELALLRLGEEVLEGFDWEAKEKRVSQIIDHWQKLGSISKQTRTEIWDAWSEHVLNVATYHRETGLRRLEQILQNDDLGTELRNSYIDFVERIGNCLDSLAAA